jgi:hypothetical protein
MKLSPHKWLLVFFMLWLPLQGAAAAALSVCVQESRNHHAEHALQADDGHHHADCHKQAADDSSRHVLANLPCDDASCDAYSNTLILLERMAACVIGNSSKVVSYIPGFVSFVPEQPQRPPLTA